MQQNPNKGTRIQEKDGSHLWRGGGRERHGRTAEKRLHDKSNSFCCFFAAFFGGDLTKESTTPETHRERTTTVGGSSLSIVLPKIREKEKRQDTHTKHTCLLLKG